MIVRERRCERHGGGVRLFCGKQAVLTMELPVRCERPCGCVEWQGDVGVEIEKERLISGGLAVNRVPEAGSISVVYGRYGEVVNVE